MSKWEKPERSYSHEKTVFGTRLWDNQSVCVCNETPWEIFPTKRTLLDASILQKNMKYFKGWTTEGSEFNSWYSQEFSLPHVVQTGSGAHPVSYPMGRGSGRGVKLTTHLELASGSRKLGCTHPLPIRLHGVVLN
jgi:hypothetical protein